MCPCRTPKQKILNRVLDILQGRICQRAREQKVGAHEQQVVSAQGAD